MMAVIIRLQNLPLSANASSIRAFFQGLKIPDGGVNIVGGEDGDAFIAFSTDDDARQAMHLNGQKINGISIKLLLSSKQEMQKIITDAQNGVLKRSAPVPSGDSMIHSDKRSITYYTPGSTTTRDNFETPSAKMRIIDHSANQNNLNRNLIFNNKENNVYDEPPRPSEFSYRMSKPVLPSNTTLVRDDVSFYRYDTPEFTEHKANIVFRPPIFEDNVPQIHNLNADLPILPNTDNDEEKLLRRTLLPTPPIFDTPLRQMNDRYEQSPLQINDRQHPKKFDDNEIVSHVRQEIPIYDRTDAYDQIMFNKRDALQRDRSDMQQHIREDMHQHERADMHQHERVDMYQHDRADMSRFDMQDMPLHDRFELPIHDRPDMSIYDRSGLPMHDRPDYPIRDRPDYPIHERADYPMHERRDYPIRDRPDLLMHERPDLPIYERQNMPIYNKRDVQMNDRLNVQIYDRPDVLYNGMDSPHGDRPELFNCGRENINIHERSSPLMYDRKQIQERPIHNRPVNERCVPIQDRYMPTHDRGIHERHMYDRSKLSSQNRSQMQRNNRTPKSMNDETQILINERPSISSEVRTHASNIDRPFISNRDRSQINISDSQIAARDRVQIPIDNKSQKETQDKQIEHTIDKPQMHILRKDNQTDVSSHHDYTERPQWLEKAKVPIASPTDNTVVRTALPPSIISPKTISDLFRNINILPKDGIKIEQDDEKRLTGYVYVKFINAIETAKALKLNSKVFRGIVINVESQDNEEFDKVVDNDKKRDNGKTLKERSPYYKDLCLEISYIPLDVTETDLKDYLNISINNKNLHFMKLAGFCYCLISATDENMMENIMKFNGVSYRGSVMKVIAISKFQLQGFLSSKGRDVVRPKVTVTAQKHSEPNKVFTTCVKLENLDENLKAADIKQLLLPVVVPLPNIILNKTNCVINLQNSTNCQNVIKDLKGRSDITFIITPITNIEFQSLKATYLNAFGGQKSLVTNEKRSNIDLNPKSRPITPTTSVRIKNLPTTISTNELKDIIKNFEYQPKSIRICFENSRNLGEAILTFKTSTEAVDFKDEFHGMWYVKKELEVLLSEN